MKRLMIFDGSNVIMRAFYAVPKLNTSTDFPTNAIKGTINIVIANIMKYKPTHVAFVVDGDKKTHRHKIFKAYKGQRVRDPEVTQSIAQQKPVLYDLLKALGIKVIVKHGVEADDIVGTLTRMGVEANMEVLIVSNDKDMAQLLTKGVTILRQNTHTKTTDVITRKECEAVYGAKPKRIPCMLMMLGDSVDNIPGVKGIGAAAIKKLFETSKRIEKADTSVLNKAQRAAFEAAASTFPLIRELVTINCDVIEYKLSRCIIKEADQRQIKRIGKALEARALTNSMLAFAASPNVKRKPSGEKRKQAT